MFNKFLKFLLLLTSLSLLVSACSLPWKKKPPVIPGAPILSYDSEEEQTTKTNQIRKFSSSDELSNFLRENSANQELSVYRNDKERISTDSNTTSSGHLFSYSMTNNQVPGVDEADIIKTDGEYIYALVKNNLKIVKSVPVENAEVVSQINFSSRPQGLFVSGSFLVVFGHDSDVDSLDVYKNFKRRSTYTFVKIFDLSDHKNPKLSRDLKFEGDYSDARLIAGYLYLFTNSPAIYVSGESSLPRVLESDTLLSQECLNGANCYVPDVYYFDIPYESYNFTNVSVINTEKPEEAIKGQSYLMSRSQHIYVSEKNIYITYTQYLNEQDLERSVKRELAFSKLNSDEQAKINEIEQVPSYILTKEEKRLKVGLLIDNHFKNLNADDQAVWQAEINEALKTKLLAESKDAEKTVIHKIGLRGGGVEYRGFGSVSGRVLNQFSMDEHDSYFRIATTRSELWSRFNEVNKKSYNNVYILNNELKLIGGLENLAVNEVIYAARFIGERVYLVTFKQTDPLYVINLVDPLKPIVLGSIKVPGYSTYLHPVDKDGNRLLGLGRDTEIDENGNVKIKGLKISLFDFSDLRAPKELDSYLLADSSNDSIALYDHKAFLFVANKNLLSIPAVLYKDGKINFAGAIAFLISGDKLALKGGVDHSEGGQTAAPDFWNSYSYYDNTVKRSLYIGDNLYTFSNQFLKINSLLDLKEVNKITLTEIIGQIGSVKSLMSGDDNSAFNQTESGSSAATVSDESTSVNGSNYDNEAASSNLSADSELPIINNLDEELDT